MALDAESALDHLARMVQMIARDKDLKQWFSGLAQKPEPERCYEIYSRSEAIRAAGEDDDLIRAFRLLTDSRVFEAACLALQDGRE